jgi:hypothetical protein
MLGDILIKHNSYGCPKCGHCFGWFQRAKFAPWGVRKIIQCPSCKEPLEWSKWPHHIIQFCLLFLFVGVFGHFAQHHDLWFFIVIPVIVAASIAVSFLKIESHSQPKNSN